VNSANSASIPEELEGERQLADDRLAETDACARFADDVEADEPLAERGAAQVLREHRVEEPADPSADESDDHACGPKRVVSAEPRQSDHGQRRDRAAHAR
jgi:hypothetical protein